jgi:hypothetical protein
MCCRRRGFVLARSSRAAARDHPVGPSLAFGQRKDQKKGRELRTEAVFNSAAEALGQLTYDSQASGWLQTL